MTRSVRGPAKCGRLGFVSMKDQATEIESRLRGLIFDDRSQDHQHAAGDAIQIDVQRGTDWQTVEWDIMNSLLPSLPYETVLRLRWSFSTVKGTTVLWLGDHEITVDGLRAELGGTKCGRLDEKIWRIFSVGKIRAPSKNILTIISDNAETTHRKYSRILEQFQTVRTWDPILTTRLASKKANVSGERKRYVESARNRIRQFLEDAEGSLLILDAPSVDQKLYTQVGFASGHSVAVQESVYRALVSDQIGE